VCKVVLTGAQVILRLCSLFAEVSKGLEVVERVSEHTEDVQASTLKFRGIQHNDIFGLLL